MKPVTVLGVTYTSVAEAWRQTSPQNLKLVTVRWRLRNGWSENDAFTLGVVPPENRRGFKEIRS